MVEGTGFSCASAARRGLIDEDPDLGANNNLEQRSNHKDSGWVILRREVITAALKCIHPATMYAYLPSCSSIVGIVTWCANFDGTS